MMEGVVSLLFQLGKLKKIKRAGWVLRGISDAETVAEHTFRVALMALLLAPKLGLDTGKCLKLALVHDLAEAVVGDITPHDLISSEEKYQKERAAMKELSRDSGEEKLEKLWDEYSERLTPEAKFVHELDKLEMIFQAYEYEKEFPSRNLDEFWNSVGFENVYILEIFKILQKKKWKWRKLQEEES